LNLKDEYPKGTRVRFVRFGEPDPYSNLHPGTTGVVAFVDDMGTVHVDWNNGSKLGMVMAQDDVSVRPDVIEKL
jgi:hypothetical protein